MYVIIALEAWDKIQQQRCIREISRGFERLSENTLLRRIDLWELYSRILSSHVHTEREEERKAFLSAIYVESFQLCKIQHSTLQKPNKHYNENVKVNDDDDDSDDDQDNVTQWDIL